MGLSVSLHPMWLPVDKSSTCQLTLRNASNRWVTEATITLSDNQQELASAIFMQLEPQMEHTLQVVIRPHRHQRYLDEVSKRSIKAVALCEYQDGELVEEHLPAGQLIVLPERSPYITHGAPVNSSFQGRDNIFLETREKFFGLSQNTVVVLEGPGSFGKTSIVNNFPRQQGLFPDVDFFLFTAGLSAEDKGGQAQPGDRKQVDTRPLAEALFHGQRLVTALREINLQYRQLERYFVIVIDSIEDWLVDTPQHIERLHAIRYTLKDCDPLDFDRIRWLLVGSWAMNPIKSRIWHEHLSSGRIPAAGQLHMLNAEAGRKIVARPTEGLLSYTPEALEVIGALTGWHPHVVQHLCAGIYVDQMPRLVSPPLQVDAAAVRAVTKKRSVQDGISRVWGRTRESLEESSIFLNTIRIVAGRPAGARLEEILAAMREHGPLLERSERDCICSALNFTPVSFDIPTILPRILEYLCALGLLKLQRDSEPRYILSTPLFAPYISPLAGHKEPQAVLLPPLPDDLTEEELQAVRLFGEGKTENEIAVLFRCKVSRIKYLLLQVRTKLGVDKTAQAVKELTLRGRL